MAIIFTISPAAAPVLPETNDTAVRYLEARDSVSDVLLQVYKYDPQALALGITPCKKDGPNGAQN